MMGWIWHDDQGVEGHHSLNLSQSAAASKGVPLQKLKVV